MSALRIYGIARTRAFRALWMAKELGLDYEHCRSRSATPARARRNFSPQPERATAGHRRRRLRAVRVAGDHALPRQETFARQALSRRRCKARRRAWQWSFWAVTEVDRGVNIWSLHAVRLPPAERDAAKRDEALKVLAAPFKVLDAAVATQPYLLGDRIHRRRSQRRRRDQPRHRDGPVARCRT